MATVKTMDDFDSRMTEWKKIEDRMAKKFGSLSGNQRHADQKLNYFSRLRSESKGLGGLEGKANREALKGEIHKMEKAKYKTKVGVYLGRLKRSTGRKLSDGFKVLKNKAQEKYQNWRNPPSDGSNQNMGRDLNNSQKQDVSLRHGMAPSTSTLLRPSNRLGANVNRQILGDPSSNRLKNNLQESQQTPKVRMRPKF